MDPTFFELVWDRRTGIHCRATFDRIDPGDIPEAIAQLQGCQQIAARWTTCTPETPADGEL